MEQSKMTQVFGISPDELKESILTDVRAELKSLALNFQPTQPADTAPRPLAQLAKKSGEIAAPVRPPVSNQPTSDEQREQYDWMNETRGATMKSLQERYAGTAREKQNIDKAISSRYEPLQKLLGEIKDPEVRETKEGKKVANVKLAVPRSFKNENLI